jgi:hypothetical protein
MRELVGAGYSVSSPPETNRDGIAVRLAKEEEVWLEWLHGDSLIVTAITSSSKLLKKQISLLLERAKLSEVQVL